MLCEGDVNHQQQAYVTLDMDLIIASQIIPIDGLKWMEGVYTTAERA